MLPLFRLGEPIRCQTLFRFSDHYFFISSHHISHICLDGVNSYQRLQSEICLLLLCLCYNKMLNVVVLVPWDCNAQKPRHLFRLLFTSDYYITRISRVLVVEYVSAVWLPSRHFLMPIAFEQRL